MKRCWPSVMVLVTLLVLLSGSGMPAGSPPPLAPPGSYVPGEVLLKFKPDALPGVRAAALAAVGGRSIHTFLSQAEHWALGSGISVEQALEVLRADPAIQYAEPNYYASLDIVPNDPRFPEMYGLQNTGQTGGTPGVDIDAVLAWNVSTGSPNVVVGDIDTGCDYNHPDLAANIWTNPGEIPANGIDDDANGFVDDVHGYNFVNHTSDPFDDNGHGSHTAGTIGAVGDNGIGVVGVNWNVKVMCIKFLDAGGSGSYAAAVEAVDYATLMGVDLTSNSWGGTGYSQTLYDAITRANAQDILFVAAAGNSGVDGDTSPHYPSSFDHSNIVSVAATDKNDAKASFSNWGAVSVDLAAPGVDILSTLPGSSYGTMSGTSMACPHVSGVLALMRALNPNVPGAQMKARLLSSVDVIPAMTGRCVSNGRLNAFFTIAEPDTVPPGTILDLAATDPGSNTMGMTWTATGDDGIEGTASYYEMRYSTSPIDETNWATATRAGNEPAPQVAGSAEYMEVKNLAANTFYYFAMKAFDEWGNPGPISNITSGTTLPPPTASVDPTSVEDALFTGQESDHQVLLSNIGVGTLDFTIPTPAIGQPYAAPAEPLQLGKGEVDPRQGDPVEESTGGPDAFGYRWVDSDEPGGPVFSWSDISLTGTALSVTSDDSTTSPVALGFNFPFYGAFFDSIRVCTNGWLSFTSSATAYSNQPLPTTGAPENLVAPFWDDLNPGGVQRIYFQSFGTYAIVQWHAMPPYSGSGSHTFQAILDSSGAITFQYLTMSGPLTSSTTGIQDASKTVGLQIAFNQDYIHDNLAVRISAVPQWLTAAPTSGRLRAGQSKVINLHLNASGLEGGTYPGTVNIVTNDPLNPVLPVEVSLHVTGAPEADVQPPALDYGNVFIGVATTKTLIVANKGTDVLHVTDVLPSGPEITADPRVFDVAPHSSQNVLVTWTPTVEGPFSGSVIVQSNDSSNPEIVVPVTGTGLIAPVMTYDPTSFDVTLYTAQQQTLPLTVHNTGGSDLIVDALADQGNGVIVSAADVDADGSGGPDDFGYRWKDSDASGGPVYEFADISATGTTISFSSSDDGLSAAIGMGMTFPFYGTDFSSVKVCTNGFLTFDTTETSTRLTNYSLPSTSGAKSMIALFWDDLHLRSGNVKYLNDGTRFIVQYTNVEKYSPSGNPLTFQVQLYPSGKILLMYKTMAGTINSATIGIQDGTKTIGLTANYNADYVHNELAVRFGRTPEWLLVTPASATIPPGGNFVFDVTFDAADRGGSVLDGAVILTNNLPETQRVPARLTIIGVPVVGIIPESHDYGDKYVGYSHLMTFQVVNNGTDTLNVSEVTTNNGALTILEGESGDAISHAEFPLPPGAARLFTLRWLPVVPGPLPSDAAVQVYSNDPVSPVKLMPVAGNALIPPLAVWSPTSFSEALLSGEIVHRPLNLANEGGSDLTYVADVMLTTGVTVAVDSSPELKKDEPDTRPGMLGSGGPDTFGYRWRDSDAAGGPVFSWTDITSIGTAIPLNTDDQNLGPFPIGFDFPFYGQTFNTFRACSNGFLSFTSTATTYTNYQLPSTSAPENLLAVFWDDLIFSSAGQAYYYNDGTRLIVSYVAVPRRTSGGPYTFEVILYPNGRIVYQYLDMQGTQLNQATIGIQNAAKDDGLTVVYNAAYVHNALAVEFVPPAGWLKVTPRQGAVGAGLSTDLDVEIDSTGLIGGDYAANIQLTTNDPLNGVITIPVSLNVTGVPHIGAEPSSLTFPMTYVGYSSSLPLLIKNVGTDVLHISAVSVSGDFSQTGLTPPVDVPVYGSIPVTVTFSPTADGTLTGTLSVTSDDPAMNVLEVPLDGLALIPPVIVVDPTSFTEALNVGDVIHRTLHVENQGGSDLTFTADSRTETAAVMGYEYLDLAKDEPDTRPGILGSGGPDTFGYTWRDSDEAGGPVFNWVDITSVGTAIPLTSDEQNLGTFPIGFDFPFYGQKFSSFRACSNGWLSFTSTATAYTNSALPATGAPENLLAVFWDDLTFSSTGDAYYYNDGTRLIVSYVAVPRLSSGGPYTFEVILYPNGRIVYQYLDMQGTRLNEATIGIQNAAKDDGLTVVFNAAYIHNEMAVEFRSPGGWLGVTPEGGTLAPGEGMDLDVVIDATELIGGDYLGSVVLTSNDPQNSPLNVPVNIHVTGIPDIAVDPLSLTFPMTWVGFSSTLPLTIGNNGTDVLHVTDAQMTGDFSQVGLPADIPVGGTVVMVTFTPTAAGTRTGSLTIVSDDPDESPFVVPLEGSALVPPEIHVTPPELHAALPPGGNSTKTLTIANTGGSDLVWQGSTSIVSLTGQSNLGSYLDLGKEEEDPRPGQLGSGGPDNFGYSWRDSDESGGPAYNWVDISTIGTPIIFDPSGYKDDGNVGPFPIGFPFNFYGQTFTDFRACTNGWLSFTSSLTTYTNQPLPNTASAVPENLLAAFWDDLVFRSGSGSEPTPSAAYYYNDGTRLIVQFQNMYRVASYVDDLTFQVILYPSGKIVYQYKTMSSPTLNSATIGMQNAAKDDGLLVVFNDNYIHDEMAVEFTRIPEWVKLLTTSGTVPMLEQQEVTVQFDAMGLADGIHEATIIIASNDPHTPLVTVPVQLNVGWIEPTLTEFVPKIIRFADTYTFRVRMRIELPAGLNPHDIRLSSVFMNDTVPALAVPPPEYSDFNHNGIEEVTFFFDAELVMDVLAEGQNIPVTIQGEVEDVQWFRGTDYVHTGNPDQYLPLPGSYVLAGQTVSVQWNPASNAQGRFYAIDLSRDGGATWERLAANISGNQYDWTAGGAATVNALFRVFSFDSQGTVLGWDDTDAPLTITTGQLQPPFEIDGGALLVTFDLTDLRLTWKAPANDLTHGPADRYRVLRGYSANGPFTEAAVVTDTTYAEPVADTASQNVVFYKIVAANAAGDAR